MTESRPEIATITTSSELRRWYWNKHELLAECRRLGLRVSGSKFRLLDRIAHFHDTGETKFPEDTKPKFRSKFDWHSAPLSPDTMLSDNYKNTQNVRRFFKLQIGDHFKFNIGFMAWIKSSAGKTLGDAVTEFRRRDVEMAHSQFKTTIAEHNQFNQYTRDFLADNPALSMEDVRHFWALKRALPSEDGRHRYDPSDLDLT